MSPDLETSADQMRRRLAAGRVAPHAFRRALLAVPPTARDPWLDRALAVDSLPEDGPDLPPGCVPYLPCDVGTVLRMIDTASVTADDVFVDVGAGLGRAAALVHLVTGAAAIAVEVQSGLARQARALVSRLSTARITVIEGDARAIAAYVPRGTVFFLFCPFSGPRLTPVLDALIAERRPLSICTVDLPVPERPELEVIWRDARLLVCRTRPLVGAP